jgi:ABC-type multidrug transport system fused ATPase/permease subunit
MELIGLGLIGPFISAVIKPEILENSQFMMRIFVALRTESDQDRILLLGCSVIFIFSIKNYLAFKIQSKLYCFSFKYRTSLVEKLMGAYMVMPFNFYLERNTSSIINTVIGHTKAITDDMLLPSLKLISDGIVLLALSIFLFMASPMAIIYLLTLLLTTMFIYMKIVKPKIRNYGENVSLNNEELIRGVNQSIGALKEIRILGVENTFFKYVSVASMNTSNSQTGFYSLMLIPRYLIEIVFVVFLVLYSFYIYNYSLGQESLISSLAVMAIAGVRMLPSITGISGSLATINYSKHALIELYEDIRSIEGKETVDLNNEPELISSNEKFLSLSVRNIGYAYPNSEKLAINNVSIELNAGESIGLVGKSGSGKTTLIDLLLGLYEISNGEIFFNNKIMNSSNFKKWLDQVAYIPQSPFLIDSSLAENVAFGISQSNIDYQKINEALDKAQLKEVLARLPEGVFSRIGEKGVKLSGGECQRVAIARAFYHNRNVFIFDEATSALDSETEKNVIEMIESLHGQKTVIVIAHRISTLKNCDMIYKLEGGSIVMSGKFSEIFR